MVLTLKHLHRSHTSFRSPKSPGRRLELCCAARPRRSPFSSEVYGDFPDGPRPLSSHQFSPLGDLPRWDFEVLMLGVVVGSVRKYQGLWSARTPAPGMVQHWKRGKPAVRGASPATFRVTCPSPRRGPEEIEILRCTQRRRSPRATRGGFARDTWLLQPTERVP